jgi:hypothetical protein
MDTGIFRQVRHVPVHET